MTNHDWNFEDAMSVNEFYDSHNCESKKFKIITCTSESGENFKALRLNTGKVQKSGPYKGRPVYSFFCLSRGLEEAGEVLDKDFLKEHWDSDLRLLEPVDDLIFGIAFLESSDDDFDELND